MKYRLLIGLLVLPFTLVAQSPEEHLQGVPGNFLQSVQLKSIGTFSGPVKESSFQIQLLSTLDGHPLAYKASIQSPVCSDTLCQIVSCDLFWDLAGYYQGFRVEAGKALTKFDHWPFSEADYEKLHRLLQDEFSLLKQKNLNDLIDHEQKRKSQKYDAVTGATALEIQNSVVPGALFSSYTLWHLANGEAKSVIVKYSESHLPPELFHQMLQSEDPHYQLFALKQFETEDYSKNWPFCLKLLAGSTPLIKQYLLKSLPAELWQDENRQQQLASLLPALDSGSKTLLLIHLQDLQKPAKAALEEIAWHLDLLSRNQLITYLGLLKTRFPRKLPASLVEQLERQSRKTNYRYGNLIETFIRSKS